MPFCRNCGAELAEGKRFCPECGEPTGESPVQAAAPTPSPGYPVQKPKRKRKPIFKRWWFWVLVVIVAASLWTRSGGRANKTNSRRTEPVVTTAPRSTPRPTVKPTESPVTDEVVEKESEPEESADPEARRSPRKRRCPKMTSARNSRSIWIPMRNSWMSTSSSWRSTRRQTPVAQR